jgi:hypothetical protein
MSEAANENPGAGGTARRAQGSCNGRDYTTAGTRRAKPFVRVSWGESDGATTASFQGREAQTLALLIHYESRGFTSGDASPLDWARRTSHYVFKLRGAGIPIATTREVTPDGSCVGRYTLTAPVRVIAREGC